MRYFWKENQQAERNVGDLIEQVRAAILHEFDNSVIAIILVGALARGEGAWKKIDNRLVILSDLDLLVVTRHGAKISEGLQNKLGNLEKETGITIDVRFQSQASLKLSARSTHLYDVRETGIAIWGDKKTLGIPNFREKDIGYKDIVALFFNRCILCLEECSPDDFVLSDANALERLTRFASDTMFTCADFITISSNSYSPSVFERVRFAKSNLAQLNTAINEEQFLSNLDKAINFKFAETTKLYLEDANDFWLAARQHLVDLFSFFFKQAYGITDISRYPNLLTRGVSLRGKARSVLSRLRTAYRLLKTKKLPPPLSVLNISFYCRMASLMLYLALGEKLEVSYMAKADEYMSKVYLHRKSRLDTKGAWLALGNELKDFHKLGII